MKIKRYSKYTGRDNEIGVIESQHGWCEAFDSIADPISIHDLNYRLVMVNQAFSDCIGKERDELVGRYCYEVLHCAKGPVENCPHKATIDTAKSNTREIYLEPADKYFSVTTSPIFDPNGIMTRSVHVMRDISVQKQTQEEIIQKSEDLALINHVNEIANLGYDFDEICSYITIETRRILSSSGVSTYFVSDDGRYLQLQKTSLPLKLNKIEKLIGTNIASLELKIPLTEASIYKQILTEGKPFMTNDEDTILALMSEFTDSKAIRKLIKRIYSLLKIKSVINIPLIYNGKAIGLIDLSSHSQVKENDVKRLKNLADQITVVLSRKLAEEKVNQQQKQLLESNEELSVLNEVSNAMASQFSLNQVLQRALKAITDVKLFHILNIAGIFLIDGEEMKLVSHIGQGHDDRFINSHKGLRVGKCLCGLAAETGKIIVSGNSSHDKRHSLSYPGMKPHSHVILPLKSAGSVLGVLYLYAPLDAQLSERHKGMLTMLGNQLATAIERAKLYEEARSQSLHDPLTGLANRNLMNIVLKRSFERAKRHSKPLSVAMLDLDNFKIFNDTYGHTSGDRLLVHIAELAKKEVREIDLVARFGGEEFLFIFPDTELDEATLVAERILKKIASADFRFSDEQPSTHTTVSIGLAAYNQDVTTPDKLITLADNALYQAKYEGRNRIVVCPGSSGNIAASKI